MRRPASSRGFTLVELMISMSIGTVVMLAVFTTYNFLGRNLTRLSYQNILESQSRKILTTLATDIRNAIAIKSSTTPTSTDLTLVVQNTNPDYGNTNIVLGSVPTHEVMYSYDSTSGILTRKLTPASFPVEETVNSVKKNYVAGVLKVPVRMTSFSLKYYTGSGGIPATPITSMSVKQVAVSFTLQPEGNPALLQQTGTMTSYAISSARLPLLNRLSPDGS